MEVEQILKRSWGPVFSTCLLVWAVGFYIDTITCHSFCQLTWDFCIHVTFIPNTKCFFYIYTFTLNWLLQIHLFCYLKKHIGFATSFSGAVLQILRSCRSWRFLHCRRPPEWGLPAAAVSPVPPDREDRVSEQTTDSSNILSWFWPAHRSTRPNFKSCMFLQRCRTVTGGYKHVQ